MDIKRLGIDLAKNSFSLCGVDANEHIVLEKALKRKDLLPFLSRLKPCTIGREAGSEAYYWARGCPFLLHKLQAPVDKLAEARDRLVLFQSYVSRHNVRRSRQ